MKTSQINTQRSALLALTLLAPLTIAGPSAHADTFNFDSVPAPTLFADEVPGGPDGPTLV